MAVLHMMRTPSLMDEIHHSSRADEICYNARERVESQVYLYVVLFVVLEELAEEGRVSL